MFTKILSGVVLVLVISLISLGALYKGSISDLAESNAALQIKTVQHDKLKSDIELKTTQINVLNARTRTIEDDYQKTVQENVKLKNREETIRKKPDLVGRLINNSVDGLFRDIECSTGLGASCNSPINNKPSLSTK